MKKILLLILMLTFPCLLLGCEVASPEESIVSESDPSLSDERLLGTWKEVMGKDDSDIGVYLTLYDNNAFKLEIEKESEGDGEPEPIFGENGFYAVDSSTLLFSVNETYLRNEELYQDLKFNYESISNFNYDIPTGGKKMTLTDKNNTKLQFTKDD